MPWQTWLRHGHFIRDFWSLSQNRHSRETALWYNRPHQDDRMRHIPTNAKKGNRTVPAAPGPEKIPLDVIFEDDDILVVDKPAGMIVHPAPGHPAGTLVNALLAYRPSIAGVGSVERPGIVHRLDQERGDGRRQDGPRIPASA